LLPLQEVAEKHVAFGVIGGHLLRNEKRLETRLLRRDAVEHVLSHAFYFLDPDGNRLEVYCWMMTVNGPSIAAPEPDL